MKNVRERWKLARHYWLAATAASLALPTIAQAQQAQLEEVTVTARKIEESLLQVPISITAISAAAIQQNAIKDIGDLQRISPSFVLSEVQGFRRARSDFSLVVRGLNVGTATTLQSPATIFIDGAPYLGGRPASFNDFERVEVLKGPQTAYFGRATFTGAINFVTKKPSKEFSGAVTGEIAQFNSSDASISVEGPITDTLSFRAGFRNLVKGPQYHEKVFNAPVGERKTQSGSAMLYWTPTDKLSVKFFGEYAEFHDTMSAVFDYPMNEFANCRPPQAGAGALNWICGNPPPLSIALSRIGFPAVTDAYWFQTVVPFSIFDGKQLLGPGDNLFSANTSTHALADYQFDNGMTLSGIVAYHRTKVQSLEESTEDAKFGFFPCARAECGRAFGQYLFLIDDSKVDRYSEVRLTSKQDQRLRWIVGATFANAAKETISMGEITTLSPRIFGFNNYTTSETKGIFGGVNFDFTDKLKGGVELRHQSDKIFLVPNVRLAVPPSVSKTFKSTTPRVSVQYSVTPDMMVYTSYAKGTRPGSFNGALLSRPQFVIDLLVQQYGVKLPIEEEELQQYELGLKGRFLDNRLQTTIAVYKGKLTNQQIAQSIFVNRPDLGLVNTIGFTNNAGRTDLEGVELEGSAVVTDRIRVDFGYAYNKTEIIADNCAQCVRIGASLQSSQGNKLDGTPVSTGFASGTYTAPLSKNRDWYARAEYNYTGVQYGDRLNLSKTDPSNRVNLRTGLRSERFDLEAYLLNAFNDTEPVNIGLNTDLPTFGVALKIGLPDKRQWGVRGTLRF
jgi:iron complex outermembrane receptor protein